VGYTEWEAGGRDGGKALEGGRQEAEREVKGAFGLGDNERDEVEAELLVNAMKHAQSRGHPASKAAALVNVAKQAHDEAMERRLPVDRAFANFKELLLQRTIERPPFSVGQLNYRDAVDYAGHMRATYFRRYPLHWRVATPSSTLKLQLRTCWHDVPPSFSPLQEAKDEATHQEEQERQRNEERQKMDEQEKQHRLENLKQEFDSLGVEGIRRIAREAARSRMHELQEEARQRYAQQESDILDRSDNIERQRA